MVPVLTDAQPPYRSVPPPLSSSSIRLLPHIQRSSACRLSTPHVFRRHSSRSLSYSATQTLPLSSALSFAGTALPWRSPILVVDLSVLTLPRAWLLRRSVCGPSGTRSFWRTDCPALGYLGYSAAPVFILCSARSFRCSALRNSPGARRSAHPIWFSATLAPDAPRRPDHLTLSRPWHSAAPMLGALARSTQHSAIYGAQPLQRSRGVGCILGQFSAGDNSVTWLLWRSELSSALWRYTRPALAKSIWRYSRPLVVLSLLAARVFSSSGSATLALVLASPALFCTRLLSRPACFCAWPIPHLPALARSHSSALCYRSEDLRCLHCAPLRSATPVLSYSGARRICCILASRLFLAQPPCTLLLGVCGSPSCWRLAVG